MMHLADILQRFLPAYDQNHARTPEQYKVCRQLSVCRTPALGGFHLHCQRCEHEQYLYHACRNRHCPRCQQQASVQWEQMQLSRVVDTTYFHVVFTLPHEINGWARLHPRVIYRLFFESVWSTLNTLGHDKSRLDGQLGMTAVLHSWGQNLSQHIHLHCLIPGGALSTSGQWHSAKSTYLFPIKVLSRLFTGKMISALRKHINAGELPRIEQCPDAVLNTLKSKDWVVYAKEGIHRPDTLVRYLARYTRKIAISESRLLWMDEQSVHFRYKDYRDGKSKSMSLKGVEFLRRYLQHVLPPGMMRIRHYGWLANACREKKLAQVRAAITHNEQSSLKIGDREKAPSSVPIAVSEAKVFVGIACAQCKTGIMVIDLVLHSSVVGAVP